MNTSFGKVAAFVLAMLPVSSLAASGSALPISSLMELKEEKEFPSPVIVSGVLGYTPSCKLAIYSDPFAARSRDLSLGVQLAERPLEELFPKGVTLGDYFGRYVLASGELRQDKSGVLRIDNPGIYHAFQEQKWLALHSCARNVAKWANVAEVLARPKLYAGNAVSLSGILGRFRQGIALYVDEASAATGAYTHAIILADREWIERNFPGASIEEIYGKHATVFGSAIFGVSRGSTPLVIRTITDIKLVD